MRNRAVQVTVVYFAVSFVLHLVWENVQMPLFDSGDLTLWEVFTMCLFATATGDMIFMGILYGAVAVVHRRWDWPAWKHAYQHPATWILPVIIGVLLAVSFELWAIHAVERWRYSYMPLVPFIHVGLTPLLQMIAIPLVVTGICGRLAITKSLHEHNVERCGAD